MRVFFVSLGCDKNLVDSEVMLGRIRDEGYEITDSEDGADVIIVNTCAFITDAVNEGIENILELARGKETGAAKKLIVTGCMPARFKEDMLNELPEIDAIVGPGEYDRIIEIIGLTESAKDGEKLVFLKKPESADNPPVDNGNAVKPAGRQKTAAANRMLTGPGHYAYLKIAEGCDNKCTYCTIPSIRGGYRSADMDGLLHEARSLANMGARELILVAQDTSLYGTDLYGKNMLHELLRGLSGIEGIKWIRLLYCYPEHLTRETINEMAANPKVCRYIDMPVQHADDGILKLMGRRSTMAALKETISELRAKMPDIVLRTTVITGFPGEGEAEFKNLLDFISEIKFDKLGAFAYSKEEGTPAYRLPKQVKQAEKKKRLNEIMELQKKISAEKRRTYIGQKLTVIVDGRIPEEGVYCGRSRMDAPDIDGLVFFEGEGLISGETVEVLITGSADYDLIGEIVNESSE